MGWLSSPAPDAQEGGPEAPFLATAGVLSVGN